MFTATGATYQDGTTAKPSRTRGVGETRFKHGGGVSRGILPLDKDIKRGLVGFWQQGTGAEMSDNVEKINGSGIIPSPVMPYDWEGVTGHSCTEKQGGRGAQMCDLEKHTHLQGHGGSPRQAIEPHEQPWVQLTL